MFIHALQFYGQCPKLLESEKCELCEGVNFFVKYGTGMMLRSLLSYAERRFKGSDAVGVKCGEMSYVMADKILESEPRYFPHVTKDEKFTEKVNMMRLQNLLDEDLPGVDLFEHMEGGDLSVNAGVYVPFLRHSNQLYTALRKMYMAVVCGGDTTHVPKFRIHLFILQCAILSNIIARNPNWLWGLSTITQDIDLIQILSTSSSIKPETHV